jgi:hypothetical protein
MEYTNNEMMDMMEVYFQSNRSTTQFYRSGNTVRLPISVLLSVSRTGLDC